MSRVRITFEAEIHDASRIVDWDWPTLIDIDDASDQVDWSTFTTQIIEEKP